jgi:general secretion pathway protein G
MDTRPAIPTRRRAVARQRRGFTLIELVVVLALIGLLVSIAAPRYFHIIDRGRDTVQRQNLTTIRDAIDKFRGDLGRYPDTLEDLVTRRYLRNLPVDPVTEKADWVMIAPTDTAEGAVFDVQPAGAPEGSTTPVAAQVPASAASSGAN